MKIYMLLTTVLAVTTSPLLAEPPATTKAPVTDTYHGVKVTEDYRWLEDSKDPAVANWSDAQNAYARSILDKLPNVEAIRKRVTEILGARTVSYGGVFHQNGTFFAIKRQPPKQQSFLIVTKSWSDASTEHVLVDPNVPRGLAYQGAAAPGGLLEAAGQLSALAFRTRRKPSCYLMRRTSCSRFSIAINAGAKMPRHATSTAAR